jgi:hypothetical protein
VKTVTEEREESIMAISAGAVVHKLGSWLRIDPTPARIVDSKPVQAQGVAVSSLGWGALDEEENQRVRKARVDMMKFQTIARGY